MNEPTAEYLEELASTLASHGSNLAALRMAQLEQKVSPYLAAPGVPSAQAGGGASLAGVNTAYAPTVAMGAAGLFITDGAIQVSNAGSTVIIDGTSNMFKIAASGTQSTDYPNSTSASATNYVQLTALGNGYSTAPTCQWMVLGSGSQRYPSSLSVFTGTDTFSAGIRTLARLSSGYVELGLTAQCGASNLYPAAAGCRYYVLKEEGI